jgi:hypothetical protein
LDPLDEFILAQEFARRFDGGFQRLGSIDADDLAGGVSRVGACL